jgi:hypothetical protein
MPAIGGDGIGSDVGKASPAGDGNASLNGNAKGLNMSTLDIGAESIWEL